MFKNKWAGPICAAAVVLFALLFRMEYQQEALVANPFRADAGQYFRIGWNIVNHGVVSMAKPGETPPTPDSYRGPGYPLLVSLAIVTGGENNFYRNLMFIQAVLGALSVALTIAIARYWLAMGFALAAGVLMAVWPHTVTFAGYMLTETFYGFSLLLGVYLLCRAHLRQSMLWYALAGITFSYATLINPAILIFPLLVGGILFFSQRKNAMVFVVCALIIPLAWSVRGTMLESGRSSGSRLIDNVFTGMEPEFNYGDTPEIIAARGRIKAGQIAYKEGSTEVLELIAERITEQPVFFAKWYLWQKPLRFWQWSIVHGWGDIYVYPMVFSSFAVNPFYRAIASLCHGLNWPLLIAAAGSVLIFSTQTVRRKVTDADFAPLLVTLIFIYATILHTLLTPDPRYAIPFRAFEILLAVSLIGFLVRKWQESKRDNAA